MGKTELDRAAIRALGAAMSASIALSLGAPAPAGEADTAFGDRYADAGAMMERRIQARQQAARRVNPKPSAERSVRRTPGAGLFGERGGRNAVWDDTDIVHGRARAAEGEVITGPGFGGGPRGAREVNGQGGTDVIVGSASGPRAGGLTREEGTTVGTADDVRAPDEAQRGLLLPAVQRKQEPR